MQISQSNNSPPIQQSFPCRSDEKAAVMQQTAQLPNNLISLISDIQKLM
jgi:hypothetical protein